MRLKFLARHTMVWSTTLSLLALGPAPILAHSDTEGVVGDWVHFVLDVRWGDVMHEPASFDEQNWEGAFAVAGRWGGGPTSFKNWEWGEDNFVYTPEVISWTSKTFGDWDGMRIRVAMERGASGAVDVVHPGEEPHAIGKTGAEWLEVQEPIIQDLGNGQELVIRVHPLPHPHAVLNVWWGAVRGPRLEAFRPDFSLGVPFDPTQPLPLPGEMPTPPQGMKVIVTIAGQDFAFEPVLQEITGSVIIGGNPARVIISGSSEGLRVAIGSDVVTFQPGSPKEVEVTVNGERVTIMLHVEFEDEQYVPHELPPDYQYPSDQPSYDEPFTEPQGLTVDITSEGFHPAELMVPAGGTVTWRNQDTQEHFVASDTHPTHELLPTLSSGNIPAGGSYSYTFTTAGMWGYHDHLFPERRGTVVVRSMEGTIYPTVTGESLPLELAPMDFSGSLTVPAGTLGKLRPLSFEAEDGILEKTASAVSWESFIGGTKVNESEDFCRFIPSEEPLQSLFSVKRKILGALFPSHPEPIDGETQACPVFHMDRDGLFAVLDVATWTEDSEISLAFSSADVSWSRTFRVEELFGGPFFEAIPVGGADRGQGVMVMLNDIADGKLIRARGHNEVYFMEDGMRRHIPDPFVFEEREFEWEEIEEVEPEELDALPEDEPLEPPDGLLFRAQGDPRVFTFEEGERRWIENPEVFDDLGMRWDRVRELPPETLFGYAEGDPFDRPGMRPPDGHFFRFEGRPEVFQFEGGRPRHILSPAVFEAHGLNWEELPVLPPEHRFGELRQGDPLTFPDGTLVQEPNSPEVFLIEDGVRREFSDQEDFVGGDFEWEDIRQIPEEDFMRIDEGDPYFAASEGVTFDEYFRIARDAEYSTTATGTVTAVWKEQQQFNLSVSEPIPTLYQAWLYDEYTDYFRCGAPSAPFDLVVGETYKMAWEEQGIADAIDARSDCE